MLPSASQIQQAVGCNAEAANKWAGAIRAACRKFDIDTPERLAAFLAQVGHESGSLARVVENLNYSADGLLRTWPTRFDRATATALARKPEAIANRVYANRMGNGSPETGDGWRYRGRGLIQLTGRANYAGMSETLSEAGVAGAPDFELQPELLESPMWAAMSAAGFWHDHDLNALADRRDFARITRRINGGTHGAADRGARYAKALRVFA